MSKDDNTFHPRSMSALALQMLAECYHLGTDLSIGPTAAARAAANFLMRAGLVKFQDAQVPTRGLAITERGRQHFDRLLALPILQAGPQGPQNGPGEAAPRFVWAYGEDSSPTPMERPLAAGDALNMLVSANGTFSNPLASSIFLEALTWDQQARVLERLGFRRVP